MKTVKQFLFILIATFSLISSQGMTLEGSAYLNDDDFSTSRCCRVSTCIAFTGLAAYTLYQGGSASINFINDYLYGHYKKIAEQQICCIAAGEWQGGSWNLNSPTLFDNLPEPLKSNCYYIVTRTCGLGDRITPYLSSWDATWNRLPFCCLERVYLLNYTQMS